MVAFKPVGPVELFNMEELNKAVDRIKNKKAPGPNRITPEEQTTDFYTFRNSITRAYKLSSRSKTASYTVPYWWNDEIQSKRTECLRSIRIAKRNRTQQTKEEYKRAMSELNKLIKRAKRTCWQDLCEVLENDVWGEAYRIATKTLRIETPYNLCDDRRRDIANTLFPNKPSIEHTYNTYICPEEISNAELIKAAESIKVDPEEATAYRPICLLDCLGKLYENVVKNRLEEELRENDSISSRQYGFRKAKSAIDAVKHITDTVKNSRKRWAALVMFDVKNAFNSANWNHIITKLETAEVSGYLINIIKRYLCERYVLVARNVEMKLTAGVPQGSVLGPTLWNVLYNAVLNIDYGRDTMAVAYADDSAILFTNDRH
ncbi:uncharacterized protein [Diabrotica undecimpunctata]|uniref:uncharacterized protein n=1 Tax=Diabrotica undecimpunctata TaxID=50387 RepID=UPI003B631F8D